MNVSVRRLEPGLRGDFYALHSEANDCAWCSCAAWWVPTWKEFAVHTAEQNRAIRDGLFNRGECDGFLLYLDEQVVGWTQVGPRDRLPKLLAQYGLEPNPEIWAITCFFVAPAVRGRKLAHQLLAAVLASLAEDGVKCIQAFPKRSSSRDPGEAWTGPESLYRAFGFEVIREDPRLPILEFRKTP
ncbi:MAG: GNAT family N-acetyltransferase [Candidatus Eisenbacteria bacterium]|nr:GNAT family N-acetyltransferase [Candidatus Eisenbacteria bacterium]